MCHTHSRMINSFSMLLWKLLDRYSIDTWSIFNQYQMHSRFQIVLIRIWLAFAMTLIRKYSIRNHDSRYHGGHPLCPPCHYYDEHYYEWYILWIFPLMHIHDIHWLMVLFIWIFLLGGAVTVFWLPIKPVDIKVIWLKPLKIWSFLVTFQVKISAPASVIGHLLFLCVMSCISPPSSPCTPCRMRASSFPHRSRSASQVSGKRSHSNSGKAREIQMLPGSQPQSINSPTKLLSFFPILKHTHTLTSWHSGLGKDQRPQLSCLCNLWEM